MRPEQQDSSDLERSESRTEAVSTKVSPREKQALHLLATVKKTTLSALIFERAVQPLLDEADGLMERLHALAKV